MSTISILKNLKELDEVKIRQLPLPHLKEFHRDHDWLRDEYSKWSKQLPGSNATLDHLMAIQISLMLFDYTQKERLLTLCQTIDIVYSMDSFLLEPRKERSAEKAKELIENLLEVLYTGKYDTDLSPGKKICFSFNIHHAQNNR